MLLNEVKLQQQLQQVKLRELSPLFTNRNSHPSIHGVTVEPTQIVLGKGVVHSELFTRMTQSHTITHTTRDNAKSLTNL